MNQSGTNNAARKVVVIGAGPAGLTAAYESIVRAGLCPVVLEASPDIGGISKTVTYKGNRMDIGGHRLFSKSERVMKWWFEMLPVQGFPAWDDTVLKRQLSFPNPGIGPDPEKVDDVLLIRNRLSRIYYLKRFFDYPTSLNWNTLQGLGPRRVARIGFSYLHRVVFPLRDVKSLEDFLVNRFGEELYRIFFKDYTEKVWGIPCNQISAEWGEQRIKGLSVKVAVANALRKVLRRVHGSVAQHDVETSLIEQFLYPKHGPGQMWEVVADRIKRLGGEVLLNHNVLGMEVKDGRVQRVFARDERSGANIEVVAKYVFSTMPVRELIGGMQPAVPPEIARLADALVYRSMVVVGLSVTKLRLRNETDIRTINGIIPDTWIYVQERGVRIGRLQVFNNWSPYLVSDRSRVWLGLEYFCDEGDEIWNLDDSEMVRLASQELASIGVIDEESVVDATVVRMPKAYPSYFGGYERFEDIRRFTDRIENLYLVGRNGMHRYNNMDHSMLTAMTAVDNIVEGIQCKDNIWAVNTESAYHESR